MTLTGSLLVSGSVFIQGLTTASQTNVLTINSSTGQVYYTASSAIGGGGGSGYTTVENEGTPLTQRTTINFVGAGVTAADVGSKTVVTINGGTGSLAAAGNNYEIQYNSGSELAATSSFRFNYLSQSLELGGDVIASGQYSHAQGSGSQAIGTGSHAEGIGCIASGTDYGGGPSSIGWSHAEGAITIASGSFSHAEGVETLTLGLGDHAEGYQTTASSAGLGIGAHAEGQQTKAYGGASHAEGVFTTAESSSHAEGYGTISSSPGSHAEGWFTTASGNDYGGLNGGTHAEGYATFSSGSWSHAEGFRTISKGFWSHVEGTGSISQGNFSHAEGGGTLTLGLGSHAEGVYTTASGIYSHAEGAMTFASGAASHAQGIYSKTMGGFSLAGGYASTASRDYSISLGVGTVTDSSVYTAFGVYNNFVGPGNSDYAIFVVGGGSGDLSRSNLFRISSSGECLAANTFTNGGADYAEYFESHNSQPIPVGTVVELTGSLIKICENPDNAIGVISNKPSILGNSDEGTGDEWVGKYEKDIWGNYVMEEYEFELPGDIDENFNIIPKTITKTRKKLNPNFDPTLQYIPRSERPEWNVVGLLGQIKVLKNQQIPTRWIKMKDISDEVALYLVK